MAAQDAELQLKVSLDLAFFKQQLAGLGQASAGYTLPIGFTFDTTALQRQIAALNKKEITIKVGDTAIDSAIRRLETLKNYVDTVKKATSTAIVIETKYRATGDVPAARTRARSAVATAVKGQSLVESSSYKDLQSLYKFADAANLEFERLKRGAASSTAELQRVLAPAFRNVGTDVKAGIKSGLANADTELAQIAANMGESLLKAVKRSLGIASPSKEFKKIGEDSGEGLEQGLKIGLGEAGDVGVREIEKLFQRLQKEAKAGSAVLQAIMAGAMGGVMQLPGTRQRGAGGSIGSMIRQQRAQVQAERQAQAGGLSALMTGMMGGVIPMGGQQRGAGGSIGAMIRQQRTAIQAQRQAEAGSLSALMMGMMGGVVSMPSKPRAGGSIGELIQKERANARERNRPQRIENLIAALSSASGNLSPAAGVNQRLSTGGAINPGVIPAGHIGRSAISPRFVNYPPAMPAAYEGRFIEPSAYASSLSTGALSRFNMGGKAVPSMALGGVGAGGGSFVPMEGERNVSSLRQSIQGLITRAKDAAGVIRTQVTPSFKDLRAQVVDVRRSVAMQLTAEGGVMGGRYVTPRGAIKSYGQFPSEGMMMPGGITANAAQFRNYSVRQNAVGGRFPLGAPYSTQSGGIRTYAFPMAGMMAPSSPLPNAGGVGAGGGSFIPPSGPPNPPPGGPPSPPSGGGGRGGMFGGFGGIGGFGRALGNINLPGSGAIRDLGGEFAFATKQVLLFGQAYKLLGFAQAFPSQVGAAVSALQSFRNTLDAVTPSAEEAKASNDLLLSLMDKYNVPLQSARDGFTKLYASMAPAGFSGDEIRNLFTGITKAAATFGMSADKVDRVNYAFAQMASKGQVMSEELKGQLGDVLPGSMALFAKAAGFEGPKAIQDFSVALEDGAYKGEAMVALLKNVTTVMNNEFGPGAEGAALTFQGVMNRMQNSMTLLYESFEPVAVGFLNTVVVPMTNGIKQVTDGLNTFFSGTAAKTSGGFALAQELERLRPAFDGIKENASALVVQLGQLAKAALNMSTIFLQIAGNPFIGYLAKVYINILVLTTAIQVLNLRALVPMIANFGRSVVALVAFTVQCIRVGQAVQVTGLMLRTFFATTGVGLVVVGIGLLIERFMTMNQALEDTKNKALGAAQAIRSMSQTEARAAEQGAQSAYKTIGRIAGRPGEKVQGAGNERLVEITPQELKQLEKVGAIQTSKDPFTGKITARRSDVLSLAPQAQALQSEASYREKQIKFDEKQAQQQAVIAPIPPSEGEGKTKKGEKLDTYDRSKLEFLQQQFDIEKQALDKKLQGEIISQTEYDIALAELKLESVKLEIAEKYRLAVEKTNKDNLSAADKALKLKDLDIAKTNELLIAEEDRNIAISAARLKVTRPILEEIDRETLSIRRQALEMEALKQGRLSLSAAQEAELIVKEKYSNLSSDEQALAKEEINLLRQQIQLRLESATALEKEQALTEARIGLKGIGGGLMAGFTGSAAGVFERTMAQFGDVDYATKLANIETSAMQLRSVFEGLQGAISGVSGAFANMLTDGITNMITGTATAKEVFVSFLQSIGQALSQAAAQMIATYISIGIAKKFAGMGGGGKQDVLGSFNAGAAQYTFANGGIAPGGFRAFANGGVVNGPTLGLVGEGKYNEAIVPLPDGKSIPVQLGGSSSRELLSGGSKQQPASPVLSMSFQSTTINGVEYVDRAQLEAAMSETRRLASRDGASRGSQLALNKIKNSPNTRRQLGLR